MKTPQEQLIEVQQAISDVLTNAQEAWYNGQKVRKADLVVLEAREKNLLTQRILPQKLSWSAPMEKCVNFLNLEGN